MARFNAAQLPKSEWNHDAHLVVGLWHAMRHPADEAQELLRARIRAHNEAVGTPNTDTGGYHESITRLFLLGVLAQISSSAPAPLSSALVHQILDSPLADKEWPLRYYSRDLLFQGRTRREWVAPDLHPAP